MFDIIGFALTLLAALFILPIVGLVKTSRVAKRLSSLETEIASLRHLLDEQPPASKQVDGNEETPSLEPGDGEEEPGEEDAELEFGIPPGGVADAGGDEAGRPQISLSSNETGDSISESSSRSGNMEQELGTKWIVWIGGLALALGGIFLVRYTIEAGLLGPGVRIALGALFALLLTAAGEYTRRNDVTADLAGVPNAYIPGVLTATGILTGFATVYAAYALYGFLPQITAFILLAACSFAALSASWLHGPGLAAVGLVGSYATPALVATQTPKAWPLFIYLLFVTGASYFAARLKGWLWLATSATAGSVAWGLLWCAGNWSVGDIIPMSFYVLTLMGLCVYFLAHKPSDKSEAVEEDTTPSLFSGMDWVATGAIAAITILVMPAVRLEGYSTPSLLLLGAVTLTLLASAWHWRNLSSLIAWSSVLFGAIYLAWHIPQFVAVTPSEAYLDTALIAPPALWIFLTVGVFFAGGFAASGFGRAMLGSSHPLWIYTSAITPIVIFAYAYLRATHFEQDVPFGILGLLIAVVYVGASDAMFRKGSDEVWGWRSGCYAAAAVVSLALAFTILLEQGWLTIALALVCPGLGWVALKRPVPGLRYLAAGMAAVVIARLAFDPVIVGDALGTTPIFNWLLYGYGMPAAAFIGASMLFRQQQDDRAVQILEAAGILCVVTLIGLQIRHLLNDGNVYSQSFDLAELSIHSISMLGLAIGLQRLYDRTNRITVEWAAAILGMTGLAAVLVGHLFGWNPIFTGESIGENPFFNLLLLAYVTPALLCGVLYWVSYNRRMEHYVWAIGATALLLLFAYISLENRALFQGPILRGGITSDAEWYAYSAIWLIYGAGLLGAGIVTGLAAFRYASLAIILFTTFKVFLSDMSHLNGILRALSFIGLGLVLVGIGYFYQRFIFPHQSSEQRKND